MTETFAPKIFGIGLSKTGTSSLAQALQALGFSTKDYMGITRYVAGDLVSIDMDVVIAHDALTDTPIPSFYRELDGRFPGSKFILTVRERHGWLRSCKKQFNERSAAVQNEAHKRLFEDLYGTDVFDEQRFASGYERFVAGVLSYFKDRPQDLLVLDVAAGEGWEKLCPFVGRPIPDAPFPKANVTQIRWMKIEDLVAVAENAGRELMKHYRGQVDPVAQRAGANASGAARTLLDRALQVALGRDATHAALRSAHKVLVAGLKKLNAEIPVLSPTEEPPAHAVRKHWNHVWLVDPLDGRDAYAEGESGFSVNIALLEDGRPIYGVVHAPAQGVTYFGRSGRGAFKREAGGDAIRLSPPERPARHQDAQANSGESSSRALALCRLLEVPPATATSCAPAREWQIAAAHAILTAAELVLRAGDSGAEVPYSTKELATPRLWVGRA